MELSNHGREYYVVQINTTATTGSPIPASGWEASFDRGETWHPCTVLTDNGEEWSAWLVAGPAAPKGSAVAVITSTVTPLARAVDSPEILVDRLPPINLLMN